jgi:hypothetical protein
MRFYHFIQAILEMVMRLIYIPFLILLAGLALNTQAREVQKWVDKDGQVHYGDYSESGNAKTVKVPSSGSRYPTPSTAPTTAESLEKRSKFLDAKQDERKKQNEAKEKAKKQLALEKSNCKIAKSQYNMLKDGGRLVAHDENGERHYMTDEERNKNLANSQKDVSKWCK